MTTVAQTRAPVRRWPWLVLVALGALFVLNGVWLFTLIATPAVVEADTGIALAELRAAYPSVADELAGRGRTVALLVAGLGAMAVAAAVAGLRHDSATARSVLWVFVGVLALVTLHAFSRGRWDVGSFYAGWSLLTGFALAAATRRHE
jgi:hypothetical protein